MSAVMPGPNAIPRCGLFLTLAFFAQCALLVENGVAGSPIEMFGVAGALLMYTCICATFLTMGIAAIRAHRSGRRAWLVAVLLAWPLAYVYTLVVDRGAA